MKPITVPFSSGFLSILTLQHTLTHTHIQQWSGLLADNDTNNNGKAMLVVYIGAVCLPINYNLKKGAHREKMNNDQKIKREEKTEQAKDTRQYHIDDNPQLPQIWTEKAKTMFFKVTTTKSTCTRTHTHTQNLKRLMKHLTATIHQPFPWSILYVPQ